MTRRDFIGNALAALGFSALPGGRLFAAPEGWKPGKKPNLVFGVVSDTHLRTSVKGEGPGANWPDKYFSAALKYFKRRGVDAVVHCGDMAHRGQVREMEFHAEAWSRVFGGVAKGPARLFITGNHDVEGAYYEDFVKNRYPDEAERAKHVLATDMAANWERIWGEKYEPVWHREIKGHHFFGRNWGVDDDELARLVEETGKTVRLDDPARPFFFMTHSRPVAPLRKRVSANRNAVSFFGHNHWSVANWNMAYLYYNRLPCFECASCEPRGSAALAGDDKVKTYFGFREIGTGVNANGDPYVTLNGKPVYLQLCLDQTYHPQGYYTFPTDEFMKNEILISKKLALSGNRIHRKAVYAAGCNLGIGHEPNGGVTTLEIPASELPPGKTLTAAVRPLTSLGTSGRPIATEFKALGGRTS